MTTYSVKQLYVKNNVDYIIYPFDPRSATAAGYDLKVGFAYVIHKKIKKNATGEISESVECEAIKTTSQKFIQTIPAGAIVIIVAREWVWLSGRLCGTLHFRGSLSIKGLVLNSTTVDPGWNGRMTFAIQNTSQFPVDLDMSDRFVTLVLHKTFYNVSVGNGAKSNPYYAFREHYSNLISKEQVADFSDGVGQDGLANKQTFDYLLATAKARGGWGRLFKLTSNWVSYVFPAKSRQMAIAVVAGVLTSSYYFMKNIEEIYMFIIKLL